MDTKYYVHYAEDTIKSSLSLRGDLEFVINKNFWTEVGYLEYILYKFFYRRNNEN